MSYKSEIEKRRTFAIISHPDAGKTTLTEKFLLFGGAIQTAGAVKSNKIRKYATSDFMEIERQRGISVATSVMSFQYKDKLINLLDTPGHKDFAEDTYRTLTAVDSVILVIDSVNGVEEQTRKLTEVCRMRDTPIIVFINKMDRDGKNRFELMEEIENELHIKLHPLTWPINNGKDFKGVYNLHDKNLILFTANTKASDEDVVQIQDLSDLCWTKNSVKKMHPFYAKMWSWWMAFTGHSLLMNISAEKLLRYFLDQPLIISACVKCWIVLSESRRYHNAGRRPKVRFVPRMKNSADLFSRSMQISIPGTATGLHLSGPAAGNLKEINISIMSV